MTYPIVNETNQVCPPEVALFISAHGNCSICQESLKIVDLTIRRSGSGYKIMSSCSKMSWKHYMLELYWENIQDISITGEDITFEDSNYRYNICKYYRGIWGDQDQLTTIFIETIENVYVGELSIKEDIFDIKNFSLPDSLNKVKMLMAFR